MQKVIRRTALAKNQAQRRARIAAKKEQRVDYKEALRQRFQNDRYRLDAERSARIRRRDDWMRGPLAPKRDSGVEAEYYGALPPHAVHAPKVAQHLRRKFINIAPGDRVSVMKGQNKGKIFEVMRVDMETETVTVKSAVQVIISHSYLLVGIA
jgi:large subunit ribosomal protein L24